MMTRHACRPIIAPALNTPEPGAPLRVVGFE
jgi:hypothetical protein